jgi:hypothetical protein
MSVRTTLKMCDNYPGETLVHHVAHCYPRTMIYLAIVATLTLLLSVIEVVVTLLS